ncbi:DNA-binding protein [Listeria grayi FSL F6-1183]|uniref:DNA-binding protein n=1 Tax=Listeria grayi FSL F6-1183 TaxID=1265827 RepID=A0A829R5K0_LISGR|nr:DNA-binding protein [Listeria grayi FSL F6-1183]
MSLYYLEDFSLGEIADEYEVSRQAVYDNIKRTEESLENYEQKLGMLAKYEEREKLLTELETYLQENKLLDKQLEEWIEKLKATE